MTYGHDCINIKGDSEANIGGQPPLAMKAESKGWRTAKLCGFHVTLPHSLGEGKDSRARV
jgi:hypothetical protein